jgi:integrase
MHRPSGRAMYSLWLPEMTIRQGQDVKTVQSLMRHANSNITMNIYTHAISSKKRRAQSKVVEMILPGEKAASA